MTARVPFAERGGRLRGVLDLATGCYPAFLFGGAPGNLLPAFHFHDVSRDWLEPRLQFLVDNGYRAVGCDEIARIVVDGKAPEPRTVALTFDDAWASVHAVALPLLQRYGLRAILFAIPARIADAPGGSPFVTWAQLREIHASGVVDVQSHTRSHAMIFAGDEIVDFVRPGFEAEPLLNRPITAMNGHVATVDPDALGTPLYVRRSRMSDARRYLADQGAADRCRRHVAANGGADFFTRPDWRRELAAAAAGAGGAFESDEARAQAIRDELASGRALLNERLGTTTVKHVALPWGVSGALTRQALEATGHVTAFAERPLLRRAIRAGDDRYQLMRLSGRFLTCLPGRGRKYFWTAV
jgi:polysaccharide deacetylase